MKTNTNFIPEAEIVGSPHRVDRNDGFQSWAWVSVEWDQVIRDGDDEIIFTSPHCKAVMAMLTEALGFPFFPVYFVDERRNYPDQVAFGLPIDISLPEKDVSAVAMAAWINSHYYPGVKRTDAPCLPQAMNEYTESPDANVGFNASFYTLADANRMAKIITTLYLIRLDEKVKTQVVRHGDKWGVVIHDDNFLDSRRMLELCGIHKLLSRYDIKLKAKTGEEPAEVDFADSIAAQAAFETRIEDGINAILAHLDRPDERGVGNTDTPVREKRLAKPADAAQKPGKSAAKQSA